MSEFMPQSNPEQEREGALRYIVDKYFPEDREFIGEMDFEDALGFVYGQLIEQGEDPEIVLRESGVIEGGDE